MFDNQQTASNGGMGGLPSFMNGAAPPANAWSSPDQPSGGFSGGSPGFPGGPMMPGGIPMLPTDPAMLQQLHPGMVPVPAPGMPPGMFMMVPQHLAMQQFQGQTPAPTFPTRSHGHQNSWS